MIEESIKNNIDIDYLLNIGSTLGMRSYLSESFFNDFKNNYAAIKLDFIEAPDRAIIHKLKNKEIEVAILGGKIKDYEAVPFTTTHPCIVLNEDHLLAKKDKINYEDLINQPIVMESRDFLSS